jgi:hypothetical protein
METEPATVLLAGLTRDAVMMMMMMMITNNHINQ